MKDSKFIELLNLYVDHQIGDEEAAVLETEIQRNPGRRRIYRQYCQMQKACSMLAENFRSEAQTSGRLVDVATKTPRRIPAFGYAVGVLAAACIALAVVYRTPAPSLSSAPAVAIVAPVESAVLATPAPTTTTASIPLSARVELQPVFAGFEPASKEASFSLASPSQVRLDWMDRVQLRDVATEELWLEQQPGAQPQDLLFSSPRRFQGQTEMTAWRFQK